MSRARRFTTQVLSWFLLATVVAAALGLIVVPKVVGGRPLTVLSGSMTPTYGVGDVVVVRPVDPEELRVGDVITFQTTSDDPHLTTHRIVGEVFGSEGREFWTQGDANNAADLSPVEPGQVRGKVWYAVPLVGHLAVWLATDSTRTLLDLLAIVLLLYGGFHVAAGLVERRRRDQEVAA